MTEREEIIAVLEQWEVRGGKPRNYTYDDFIDLLNRIRPGDAPSLLHLMKRKNVIKSNGMIVGITDIGLQIFPKNRLGMGASGNTMSTEAEWADFRKLLSYYIECVKTEDRKEFHLSVTKQGQQFYIPPTVPSLWFPSHKSDFEPDFVISLKARESKMLHAIAQSTESSPEACIGYPIEARFDENGEVYDYLPLFLIPICFCDYFSKDDRPGKDYKVRIKPLFKKASYNFEWITRNCDLSQLDELFDELEEDDGLNLAHALRTIIGYSTYSNIADEFDPERTVQTLPKVSSRQKRRKLCNTVILFRTDNTVFNNGLIRELKMIEQADAAELDKSALAYIFRKHPYKDTNEARISAIPFLTSNSEQLEAVEDALSHHLTVLQGPPGTGKSQVAVNLIANCVYRGMSVVFSSRNHAALEAIHDRADTLLSESRSIPLIRYCNSDDGGLIDWYQVKPEEEARTILSAVPASGEASAKIVLDSANTVSEIKEVSEELNNIVSSYLKIEQKYISELTHLKSILVHVDSSVFNDQTLSEILRLAIIVDSSKKTGIAGFLYRMLHGKKIEDARIQLVEKYHLIPSISIDKDKKLDAICKKLVTASASYRKAKAEVNKAYAEYHAAVSVNKDYSDDYNAAMKNMIDNASSSLLYKWGEQIRTLDEKDYEFIGQQRSAASKSGPTWKALPKDRQSKMVTAEQKMFSVVPAWAVSLLSARHASPLAGGVFDMVVIDEASQCDCVSVIPMLFRAKRAMIIGDPEQFRPIITMSKRRHDMILGKYYSVDSNTASFEFYTNTAYSIASRFAKPSMLKEHFRCDADIAGFINKAFYNGNLRIRTNERPLNYPPGFETGDHLRWINIEDGLDHEISTCIGFLKDFKNKNYNGSIGVVTPLRAVANRLANEIYENGFSHNDVKVDTAYGFQGGECDVILFVLGYLPDMRNKQIWYLTNEQNNNIYDVALSRAKACLIVIGNKTLSRNSSSKILSMLSEYSRKRDDNVTFDSVWEEALFNALQKAGIETKPQYSFLGYRFDMAYQDEFVRLDIEVDGYQYHFNADGSRKESDFRRDAAIEQYGWKPMRFVVKELIEDMDYCVDTVRAEINHARNKRI